MSVVFDFNASTNDVAPVSPILLSVDFMRIEKRKDCCWMLFVLFILCPPLTSSPVSVVFDFNAPLNDFAPVYPIQLSVVW